MRAATLFFVASLCGLCLCFSALGQETATNIGTSTWIPKGQVFEPLMLDPLEAQSYGSITQMANAGSSFTGDLYVPFAVGFSKGIWHRTSSTGAQHQVSVELTNFTQFEWLDGGKLRNMLNSDYKVGFQYQYGTNHWHLRARWYHLSSHLGDDHFIRRGISNFQSYTPQPNNYELIDVTVDRYLGPFRFYVGVGAIARLNSPREQFVFQGGFMWKHHLAGGASPWHLMAGADLKAWDFLNYTPGMKYAAGIGYGQGHSTQVAVLLEGYYGHIPYGLFERSAPVYTNPVPAMPKAEWGGRVQWVGLGLYVNPTF